MKISDNELKSYFYLVLLYDNTNLGPLFKFGKTDQDIEKYIKRTYPNCIKSKYFKCKNGFNMETAFKKHILRVEHYFHSASDFDYLFTSIARNESYEFCKETGYLPICYINPSDINSINK